MRSKSAKPSENLLDELQAALSHGTVARRVETLRRVTDLFINNAVDYSDEHIRLFDDVFQCLVEQIETSAKALLADRLAPAGAAPPKIIRTLALDDVIDVAGPVLSKSERLDEATLLEIARSKSQAHLKAISLRRVLSDALTDVLVARGNDEVVQSTVSNPGAHFSEESLVDLVTRAERDDDLATCIGLRPDLPRHHYLKLVAKASLSVRRKLEAANPELAGEVSSVVQEATQRIRAAAMTRQTKMARALVKSLHEDGRLNEYQVGTFAEQGKFDETNAGLAALAGVSIEIAENMMIESRTEGVMILAKVANMSWSSVRAIIAMREKLSGGSQTDMLTLRDTYEALRSSTAQQVLRFHRMQQSTTPAA
ncbi:MULTISPECIES: DUF2336 domain-containing protein [unclassified Bradyrhizobium]|uniref:DUF2336 domain-containing protein n=1 Tax=unclassified Bradyrhizobium TaxID=2631580 RepID=UPI002479449D|nr:MULTISPECIES: DUF2336 domain-containing protein [unclassified Bradyrhizobium]WGR69002.1 DUF2336 domain-containing protein [Bradyrhizobium sp. ISRA426]WGR81057.1 DUF2336 domain-containing protein [Bradyrhizobium sp. ISRA430]WGR84241.1 DUF2336 domain-containing protein [Bradyrhizobium sp. ISRA432]